MDKVEGGDGKDECGFAAVANMLGLIGVYAYKCIKYVHSVPLGGPSSRQCWGGGAIQLIGYHHSCKGGGGLRMKYNTRLRQYALRVDILTQKKKILFEILYRVHIK